MAYTISKEDLIKEGSSLKIDDGFYASSIVGYAVFKKQPFNEGDDEFFAVRFAMQLVDDEGHNKVVQSADMRISLAEKSSLFKQLAGWSKAASPTDLWDRLEKAGFMDPNTGNLNFDKFLGVNLGLMVKMTASKKDASKMYPEFTFAASKKDSHTIDTGDYAEGGQAIPIWIPDFVKPEDVEETSCLEGFEWKRYEKKDDEEKEKEAPKTRAQRIAQKPVDQVKAKIAKEPEAPEEPVNAQKNEAPAPQAAPTPASQRLVIRKRNKPQAPAADNAAIGSFSGEPMDDKSDLPF
jgi:hypothetical protein